MEYRTRLVARLAEAAREFRSACEAGIPERHVEGDWSLHQIAAHVRDVDRSVYGDRARRTLAEEDPFFNRFDADNWMAGNYRQAEPLKGILEEFIANLDDLCRILNEAPASAWARVSRHETMGEGLTLQLWVERSLAHIEEHLQTITKSG